MRRKNPSSAHYFFVNDPVSISHYLLLMVLIILLVLFSVLLPDRKIGGPGYEFIFWIFILLVLFLVLGLLLMLSIFRADEKGITVYSVFSKKKTILWENICCCGFFYHYTYIGRKKKFFYFSTKPLSGDCSYLALTRMARLTDTFLYVSEQRNVEEVISQLYPKFNRYRKPN